jgi:hypothetical protein
MSTGSWRCTFPVAADAREAPVVAARFLSPLFLRWFLTITVLNWRARTHDPIHARER